MIRGIITGCILYLLLIIGDKLYNTQTVRLLLNIDFITHRQKIPLIMELIPHFIVSIGVYAILKNLYKQGVWFRLALIVICVIFILLYFLLMDLSLYYEYHSSFKMFIVWMTSHVIYLLIVYRLIRSEVYHANIQNK